MKNQSEREKSYGNCGETLRAAELKRAVFQCSRRAMLENELVMKRFAADVVKDSYDLEKLIKFNELMEKIYDNDLFDIIMGHKPPEFFKNSYDFKICSEIAAFAEEKRNSRSAL